MKKIFLYAYTFYFLLINLTLSELRDYCRQSQMRFSFLLIFPMNENESHGIPHSMVINEIPYVENTH